MKKLLPLVLAFLFVAFGAHATPICGSYPFVFANGQQANANQVNSNFNWVNTCLNATNTTNFTTLRANTAILPSVIVDGSAQAADGGGGLFIYNPLDNTSPDNGSTIIVDAAGHRWYRSGGQSVYVVTTTANLASLPIAGAAEGLPVLRIGNRTAGDMPPALYTLDKNTCSLNAGAGDNGGQIASTTAGNCWILGQNASYDARWWGAYADVLSSPTAVTMAVTSGNGSITIAGRTCSSADTDGNKEITFTQITSSTGATPSLPGYQGKITGCAGGGAQFVIAPLPTYSVSTVPQNYAYGHPDTAALNAWAAYVSSKRQSSADYLPAVMGGATYGVDGPITTAAGLAYQGGTLSILSSANCTATNGIWSVTAANTTHRDLYFNANYLPCNSYYQTANGVTETSNLQIRHWFGHFPTTITKTVTGSNNTRILTITGDVATGITAGMIFHPVGGLLANLPDRNFVINVTTGGGNTTLLMNKINTGSVSGSATFYNDANGMVVAAGGGVHGDNTTLNQFDGGDMEHTNNADNTGCGLMYGGTQSDFKHLEAAAGAADICMTSSATQGLNLINPHLFNANYSSAEVDPPAILVMDAPNPALKLTDPQIGGAIQYIVGANGGVSPIVSMGISSLSNSAVSHVTFSGNQIVQIIPQNANAIDLSLLRLDQFVSTASGLLTYGIGQITADGTCGSSYSFTQLPCAQAAIGASLAGGFMFTGRNLMYTYGINLMGGNLSSTNVLCGGAAPTISSGFGTSPAVSANNGSCAFKVTVGTGGTDSTGAITMHTTAATAWACHAEDITTTGANFTKQAASTTGAVTLSNYDGTGAAKAWNAGDVLLVTCAGL